MMKQAIKEAVILSIVAVVLAAAVYVVRPDKVGLAPGTVDDAGGQPATAEQGFAEISIDDARRHFGEKGVIFADARHPADYEAGHIQGAVNLYASEPDAWLTDVLAGVDPQDLIIAYCDGEDCHLATQLAELLVLNGFENVTYLKNGWTRWRESGYPID